MFIRSTFWNLAEINELPDDGPSASAEMTSYDSSFESFRSQGSLSANLDNFRMIVQLPLWIAIPERFH